MCIRLEDDHDWKALIDLESEHDPSMLQDRQRSWAVIADMYLKACANPHLTGGHWKYIKSLADDAIARSGYCLEKLR